MRPFELTPRLAAAAALVPPGAKLADIGTDHAYLPVWLLREGRVERAIAADLHPGPLARAKATAARYSCTDQMDFRLCDGLSGLRAGEADTIVIAGMGGETIADILARAPWVRDGSITLILQPMSCQPQLRRWLWTNGFHIRRERIGREGKRLYTVFLVSFGGASPLTVVEEWTGRQDREQLLREEYLDSVARKVSRALSGHRKAAEPDREAIDKLQAVLAGLLEMKGELEHGDAAGR